MSPSSGSGAQVSRQRKPVPAMSESEDDALLQGYETWATDAVQMANSQMSVKIAPPFDGSGSWFAYEQAIDDWITMTTLDPAKHGLNLKNRLTGDAALKKPFLDNAKLKDPDTGVEYFKKTLRKWYIKGNEYVYLWRFMNFQRTHRMREELINWIARFEISLKRVKAPGIQ